MTLYAKYVVYPAQHFSEIERQISRHTLFRWLSHLF